MWAADGKSILFWSQVKTRSELFRVNRKGRLRDSRLYPPHQEAGRIHHPQLRNRRRVVRQVQPGAKSDFQDIAVSIL
jgi:hypothetical protein